MGETPGVETMNTAEELTVQNVRQQLMDRMRVDMPEGEIDGMRIKRFHVPSAEENLIAAMASDIHFGDRAPEPGDYTKIEEGETLWMSDTTAELEDHLEPMLHMLEDGVERVLINGLGLGCVLQGAMSLPHIRRIDVVEKDRRVIQLVGNHYKKKKDGGRVFIHNADAFHVAWDRNAHFDVIWHDIWPDISTTNLEPMTQLYRKYRRKATWQGFWCIDKCRWMWDEEETLFQAVIEREDGQVPGPSHQLYRAYTDHESERRFLHAIPEEQ
jgi:hypothetical protein